MATFRWKRETHGLACISRIAIEPAANDRRIDHALNLVANRQVAADTPVTILLILTEMADTVQASGGREPHDTGMTLLRMHHVRRTRPAPGVEDELGLNDHAPRPERSRSSRNDPRGGNSEADWPFHPPGKADGRAVASVSTSSRQPLLVQRSPTACCQPSTPNLQPPTHRSTDFRL